MNKHEKSGDEHVTCRHLLSTLGDYVEGTLAEELCDTLERHMKGCQRCRIVVDTLKKTVALYHETSSDTQMPDDVRQRLYLKLNLNDYLK
jgi:hypothetical protein